MSHISEIRTIVRRRGKNPTHGSKPASRRGWARQSSVWLSRNPEMCIELNDPKLCFKDLTSNQYVLCNYQIPLTYEVNMIYFPLQNSPYRFLAATGSRGLMKVTEP